MALISSNEPFRTLGDVFMKKLLRGAVLISLVQNGNTAGWAGRANAGMQKSVILLNSSAHALLRRASDAARRRPATVGLLLIAALTLVRVGLLFATPLELYPDEAQYWLWSLKLAAGYFSKPPMIAWLIAATTAIGGNGEAWVRIAAPFLHAGAAIALFAAGRRLYDTRAALWAAGVYSVISGVQLSSLVISTDAPLMLCVSLALLAYAGVLTSDGRTGRRLSALAFGAAVGLGLLTKYATLYIPAGVCLHAVVDRNARVRWEPVAVMGAVAAAAVLASPNLAWNVTHHFQTVAHTADNADIGDEKAGLKSLFGPRGPFGFLLGQFGVFGPLAFAVVLLASWRTLRSAAKGPDLALVCIAAPAFVIVLVESVVARANANWAGASYPACALLCGAALSRWRSTSVRAATIGVQALVMVAFVIGAIEPNLADRVGAGAALKRARGWAEGARQVAGAAREAASNRTLSAIAVDDRFLFNALSYYGRDRQGRPAGALPAPLRAWIHLDHASNQAEAESPLTAAEGARVFAVSASGDYVMAFRADFKRTEPVSPAVIRVPLGPKHARVFGLFVGQDYAPTHRDLATGRPVTGR